MNVLVRETTSLYRSYHPAIAIDIQCFRTKIVLVFTIIGHYLPIRKIVLLITVSSINSKREFRQHWWEGNLSIQSSKGSEK